MTDERAPEGAPESKTEPTAAPPPANEATTPATPAYTPPSYTPPPVPPPVMPQPPVAQPAVAWSAPPATAPAAVGQRTTLSLAAGILLVILGTLGVLFSLAVLTIGREVMKQFDFSSIPGMEAGADPNAIVTGVITFLGIFVLACSTFYIVGGVGVMRSKNWGRVIGIIIGILAGLLWLGSLANGSRGDVSFALVLLVVHAYIAVVLLFFWRTKASTA
jgi:hypothetical protein